MFLKYWSKEQYGIWILIAAIPSYLSLGEAGFATQAANEVSMAVAAGDMGRARRSLHTAWGFLVTISIVLVLAAVGAFFLIPWSHWLTLAAATANEIRWTILFLSLYSILGICLGIYRAIYRAAYKNARNSFLTTSGRLVELVAMGFTIAFSHSMVRLAVVMLLVRLVTFTFLFIDSRILSPGLCLGLQAFSVVELKRTWRPSIMFMASTLGNGIYFQGLTLLVGIKLGPTSVVVFNTTRTLTRAIVQFVTLIKYSVWPEFSYLFGNGDLVRARRLNELSFEAAWLVTFVLATGIYITAPWIIPIWTHHAVQVDTPLLVIFLASAVLNGLWFVTSGLLMGTNNHEGLTVRYLLAATFALGLGMVTVHWFGIYGVAFSMVICELLLLPYAISRTCGLLHQSVKEFLFDAVRFRAVRQMMMRYYHHWMPKAG
jgi:O-antigen/teichoic acid export membrane protein